MKIVMYLILFGEWFNFGNNLNYKSFVVCLNRVSVVAVKTAATYHYFGIVFPQVNAFILP